MDYIRPMASTFRIGKKQDDGPKDSGPAFKWLVRLCGVAVIGGLFLDFMRGYDVMELLQIYHTQIDFHGFGEYINREFIGETTPELVIGLLLLLPWILFPIIGLLMVFRGKYSGGPFTVLLLIVLAGFILFRIYGEEAVDQSSFFAFTDLGFWVSSGGLFLPFVGMFFLDKSI